MLHHEICNVICKYPYSLNIIIVVIILNNNKESEHNIVVQEGNY